MSRRNRDILRIREVLSGGQLCPVFGSEHHPYLRFHDAPLPQSEQETDGTAPETSQRELESARQTSEALHRPHAMQETETENLRTSIRTHQEEMDRLESALAAVDKEDDHSLMYGIRKNSKPSGRPTTKFRKRSTIRKP
jgi:septal ring factor EnvC (AmiA/AmiB activator)